MNKIIQELNGERTTRPLPDFNPGDTVVVQVKVVEGDRERVQAYEGVDERFLECEIDEQWSIGDYVLTGGELPALVVIDAIARLLPGTLGSEESAEQESFTDGLVDWPHYTRPPSVDGRTVPEVLVSGDHAAIRRWRLKQALGRTWLRRPELLERRGMTSEERVLLEEFRAEYAQRPGTSGLLMKSYGEGDSYEQDHSRIER